MQEPVEAKQECPVCRTIIPVYSGYVTWCDKCGWNINPEQPDPPRGIFESVYASLGQKQSRALLDRLKRADTLKPRLTASKSLALIFAVVIYGFTLAFGVGGATLLIAGWPNPFAVAGGLLCIGIVWILRPRFSKLPDTFQSQKELPTLYRLADTIGASLDARRLTGIAIEEGFTAAFDRVGWQRKDMLYLGLPLWSTLEDQEKVALIAHELAHGVNGDLARGFFIGSAMRALANLYALLRPDHIWDSAAGIWGLVAIPFNLAMVGLAGLPWLGAYVLSHLLWRDSQRAEYLADLLAASTSGTNAMLSLMEKLHFSSTFALAVHRAALSKGIRFDLFDELDQLMMKVPQRELERIKRVQQLEMSRLNATHPPTAYRIDLLRSHYVSHPKVEFPSSDFEQLEREMFPLRSKVQRKLEDMYRSRLYSLL